MTDTPEVSRISEYPALPPAGRRGPDGTGSYFDAYTVDQMRTYAAQAVEVDRAARGVPDGWVLVPIEATTEMVLALMGTGLRNTEYKSKAASPSIFEMKQGYRSMLAAAPQPAAQPERKPIPREHRKALIDAVERFHGIKDAP